jgi:endonuclease/exonuclease/phosphatase family metal-dependent hydrolase
MIHANCAPQAGCSFTRWPGGDTNKRHLQESEPLPVKIATWNINGVKARLETVKSWLEQATPDIACLQEIKSVDENFPREAFEDLGYHVETHGQKGFNGVAILSKLPFRRGQSRPAGRR